MLSLGMRLPRKSRDKNRTLHTCVCYVLCDLMFITCVIMCLFDEWWVYHVMYCVWFVCLMDST